MSSTNDVVNFVAKHGVFHSRMLSCMGRNVQHFCNRYDVSSHGLLNCSSSDISKIISEY